MEESPEEAATAAASASAIVTTSGSAAAGSGSSSAAASAGRRDPWALIRRKLSLNLPPGYHFLPTDSELIVHFLRPKLAGVRNDELPLPIFFDEHVIAYRPEQLVEKYREHGENRWFFFTRRERKHAGGKRPNRTTPGGGHWNATSTWRLIYVDGELVGCVGTQVFYETSRKKKKGDETPKDEGKTHWTMYEYESLTSMDEFNANRNGEGNMDELVLCTIQKKKHCKKKQSKKQDGEEEVDQEDSPCSGNNQKKRRCVGRKGSKDQESSIHVGGSSEEMSSCVGGSNNKKGRPAVAGSKRRGRKKILAQGQEAAPQPEQMEVTLGSEFVNTDPHVNRSNCSVTTTTLPMSYQEMMLFPAAGSTQSHNVHPNHVMHHNFSQPKEVLMLPRPTLQEHIPYEQPYFNPQQYMQHNIMAPPKAYTQGLGLGYSNYGYGNVNHLFGTNMDYHDFSSSHSAWQPSCGGVGGSTSTEEEEQAIMRSGYQTFLVEP